MVCEVAVEGAIRVANARGARVGHVGSHLRHCCFILILVVVVVDQIGIFDWRSTLLLLLLHSHSGYMGGKSE
jgi:hypothetical protein